MARRQIDLGLTGYDELFMNDEQRADIRREKVMDIPLGELHAFKDHPFGVRNDEEMQRMLESIKTMGVMTPALARPREEGGYEVVSGHRRLAALQLLGAETMPVIVREMDDEQAIIAMVDANLQREHILPSEKAFAYKMKLDAIKRQGERNDLTSCQVGERLLSVTKVSREGEDSERQIHRYIRLTHLVPQLLEMVDAGKVAMSPAVEISFLSAEQQLWLLAAMELHDCVPSHAQSLRLKKLSQDGELTRDGIYEIMREEKPNQKDRIRLDREEFGKFFPKSYTDTQIKNDILKGLELLKKQRERSHEER